MDEPIYEVRYNIGTDNYPLWMTPRVIGDEERDKLIKRTFRRHDNPQTTYRPVGTATFF